MAQGVTCSEPWPLVGNVRQNWYPMLTTGNWHFSATWQQFYIQWGRTYKSQTGKAESSPGPTPELQSSDALGHGGVGGAIQAACRQAFDREQSNVKSVLRKCFMPMISGLGFWIQGSGRQMTLKYKARYIPTDQSKKAPEEGCTHSLKLLLSEDLLSVRLASRLH